MPHFTTKQNKESVARLRKLRPIAKQRLKDKPDDLIFKPMSERAKRTASCYHRDALQGVFIYQDARKRWQADVSFKVPDGVPDLLGSYAETGLDSFKEAEEAAILIIQQAMDTEPPDTEWEPFYSFHYFGQEFEISDDMMERVVTVGELENMLAAMERISTTYGEDPETFPKQAQREFMVAAIALVQRGCCRYPNYESNLATLN